MSHGDHIGRFTDVLLPKWADERSRLMHRLPAATPAAIAGMPLPLMRRLLVSALHASLDGSRHDA